MSLKSEDAALRAPALLSILISSLCPCPSFGVCQCFALEPEVLAKSGWRFHWIELGHLCPLAPAPRPLGMDV